MNQRHAGLILPLFSARSTAGWGIGELPDLVPLATWMGRAGLDRLMVLPLGTMQEGETSPYSAASTLAIDPIYVALDQIPEFQRAGGASQLSAEARDTLGRVRQPGPIQYGAVRRLKHEALACAFSTFTVEEWEQLTTRASAFAAYTARERWWLEDYALFQSLSRAMPGVSWRAWPQGVRDREPRALDQARRDLKRDVMQEQYVQWVAETQWQEARARARQQGISVTGDMPFVAATESADVWARASEYMLDVSVGCPPDAFSDTGQDWGLPAYRWEALAETGFTLIRQRTRRMAALYDGLRVDHLVGLYRTYSRPSVGEPFFMPADQPEQLVQGEAVLGVLIESGMEIIAEDLGDVPDFVRQSLARHAVPGSKVMRWEREYDVTGAPFVDPAHYVVPSAALTGTHDTESLAEWWEVSASEADRAALLALPFFQDKGFADPSPRWSIGLRDLTIELAYRAASNHLFIPVQDIFGWRDRINVPGTVGPHNWSWALPWPVDHLVENGELQERAAFLSALARSTGRA